MTPVARCRCRGGRTWPLLEWTVVAVRPRAITIVKQRADELRHQGKT